MKSIIRLPIQNGIKLLVAAGDIIDPETALFEFHGKTNHITISIAELLRVKPSQIFKYLTVIPGNRLDPGTPLARRRSFFSSSIVKSPVTGIFKDMNLKNGTITIVENTGEKGGKKRIPLSGKVMEITRSFMEIETEGEAFNCKNGQGEDAIGDLAIIDGEVIGILDINIDVSSSIVMCRNITPESTVKLEVMGAAGLVLEHPIGKSNIPWVELDKEGYAKLHSRNGRKIWMSPDSRQIVAFN